MPLHHRTKQGDEKERGFKRGEVKNATLTSRFFYHALVNVQHLTQSKPSHCTSAFSVS